MKPIGLRPFRWTFGWRKIRGKWTETYEDRIVRRPNRAQQVRRAIEDQNNSNGNNDQAPRNTP